MGYRLSREGIKRDWNKWHGQSAKGLSEEAEMGLGTGAGPTHKGPYNYREVGRLTTGRQKASTY